MNTTLNGKTQATFTTLISSESKESLVEPGDFVMVARHGSWHRRSVVRVMVDLRGTPWFCVANSSVWYRADAEVRAAGAPDAWRKPQTLALRLQAEQTSWNVL